MTRNEIRRALEDQAGVVAGTLADFTTGGDATWSDASEALARAKQLLDHLKLTDEQLEEITT